MNGRVRSIAGYQRVSLSSDWEFCAAPADSIATPDALGANLQWRSTTVPTTAAASLRSLQLWSLDDPPRRFDAEDWWYRCRFAAGPAADNSMNILGFDGLATVADVWLNGKHILASENMFIAHELCVDEHLRDNNEVVIRFKALDKQLITRRARPRWRAPMIENQQLRWFRTTLLGRTPGWSPPAAAVGPWQPIWLEQRRYFNFENTTLHATITAANGVVELATQLSLIGSTDFVSGKMIVERNGKQYCGDLNIQEVDRKNGLMQLTARVCVPTPDLWWPHTHGEPALYTATVQVTSNDGTSHSVHEIDLGALGFRTITLNTDNDDFKISVNGIPIFCRGACWTPIDAVTLTARAQQYVTAIKQVRDVGMNMLRISGSMTYECADFLDLCDQNGILLWQDLMFANMDYPEDDAHFVATVTTEIQQQLAKLSSRACLAVLCGNSEVEQQAAMWGAPKERWSPQLFHETIPALIRAIAPAIHYWPSSAHGGSFPHQNNVGTTSYYGVGAYLRPLEDARRSEVRFATECLAFANIPEDSTIEKMPRGLALRVHHPEWKARTPRDLGAGWDFEDVRDHYLQRLFNVDPLQLRYSDHDRYLELSRVVTGEVMAAAFAEWRRKRSVCNGAFVWFLRDLWTGAGWGVVDATGMPKAAYYYLQRVLKPTAVFLSEEGCNGLTVHIVNERATSFDGTLQIALYRDGEVGIAKALKKISISSHDALEIPLVELFEAFLDANNAYRFGPPSHDLVTATLMDSTDFQIAQAFHLPLGIGRPRDASLGLSASCEWISEKEVQLTLHARRFAQAVCVSSRDFQATHNYFHIPPGGVQRIRMLSPVARNLFRGSIAAVNGATAIPITSQR